VQAFLLSAVTLGLLVAVGIVAIVAVRSRWLGSDAGQGDWESALVGYKNLRDKGVLSEDEYRKISTLVEPLMKVKADAGGQVPAPRAGVLRGHDLGGARETRAETDFSRN
jgi:hypothetical protein